jgi:uncharacterized protein (TIGR00730 family)
MKSVAVFCGSSFGNSPAFATLAGNLGRAIARRGMTLVYGGGKVGLMGVVADAALATGGDVVGVIPQQLMDKELGHAGVSRLIVTTSMHERKATMEREADGFISLPGGFGTLDEFFEILTWAQLGIHRKPCAILDTGDGFYRHLLSLFDDMVRDGFVRQVHRDMVMRETDPDVLLERMASWQPTMPDKWGVPVP